jgi:hypothetical protein
MAAKLTRLTHKIEIQLRLVAESCTICSSRYKRPIRELLDKPSYIKKRKERRLRVFENRALGNIWTQDGVSGRRLEKTA